MHLIDKATAEKTVAQLTESEEEGWTYKVVEHPNGYCHIEVYDEEDVYTGRL